MTADKNISNPLHKFEDELVNALSTGRNMMAEALKEKSRGLKNENTRPKSYQDTKSILYHYPDYDYVF